MWLLFAVVPGVSVVSVVSVVVFPTVAIAQVSYQMQADMAYADMNVAEGMAMIQRSSAGSLYGQWKADNPGETLPDVEALLAESNSEAHDGTTHRALGDFYYMLIPPDYLAAAYEYTVATGHFYASYGAASEAESKIWEAWMAMP